MDGAGRRQRRLALSTLRGGGRGPGATRPWGLRGGGQRGGCAVGGRLHPRWLTPLPLPPHLSCLSPSPSLSPLPRLSHQSQSPCLYPPPVCPYHPVCPHHPGPVALSVPTTLSVPLALSIPTALSVHVTMSVPVALSVSTTLSVPTALSVPVVLSVPVALSVPTALSLSPCAPPHLPTCPARMRLTGPNRGLDGEAPSIPKSSVCSPAAKKVQQPFVPAAAALRCAGDLIYLGKNLKPGTAQPD